MISTVTISDFIYAFSFTIYIKFVNHLVFLFFFLLEDSTEIYYLYLVLFEFKALIYFF
jgi:hypothetical protein